MMPYERILIVGYGLLGQEIHRQLSGKATIFLSDISLDNANKIDFKNERDSFALINRLKPDLVINTAAMSDVDGCEYHYDDAFSANVSIPQNIVLANINKAFIFDFMQISTDYIFDGRIPSGNAYNEYSKPAPQSVYGLTKHCAECIIKELMPNHYIIRTAWLFGKGRDTFIDKIVKSDMKLIQTFDQKGNCTYTKHLTSALVRLIQDGKMGTFNITNYGAEDRETFLRYVIDKAKKKIEIRPYSERELDDEMLAKRPKNSSMESIYPWIVLPRWQDAMDEYLKEEYGI